MYSLPLHQLEVSCHFHVPAALPPGKLPLVELGRTDLDDMEKGKLFPLPGLELRFLDRPNP
jgi:hypothetical protein